MSIERIKAIEGRLADIERCVHLQVGELLDRVRALEERGQFKAPVGHPHALLDAIGDLELMARDLDYLSHRDIVDNLNKVSAFLAKLNS